MTKATEEYTSNLNKKPNIKKIKYLVPVILLTIFEVGICVEIIIWFIKLTKG